MREFCKRLGLLLLILCLMAVLVPVRAEAAGNFGRISGKNRCETAFLVADEMKAVLGGDKFQTIIIASGSNYADALSGSYLANVKSAPILLSWNDTYNYKIKEYIRANLAPGGTVYILGGTAAVPESMESGLGGFHVRRLSGANRYETNLQILKEAGVPEGTKVLVCTGSNYADSLSASATGLPILLVNNDSGKLADSQKAYLATLDSDYYVIGGTGAVSNTTAGYLFDYSDHVYRVSGANRFETSVKVAKIFFGSPEGAVLAYAWNYPDGLCGGPLAYAMGYPLILTATDYETEADLYTQSWYIRQGMVLGGSSLISDHSARMIFTCAKPGNEYRPGYDLGSARNMEGTPYVLTLFVDDNESSWTADEVSKQWNEYLVPALDYLEGKAGEWGVSLDFQMGCYYTGMNERITVRYNGIIYSVDGYENNTDMLDQIAQSLNFESKEDMGRFMEEYTGEDDIVYVVMVNKDGRCYAISDSYHNGADTLDYCMIYTHYDNYTSEVPPASIAHEVLHLFGAEDYYYESEDHNLNRSTLAQQLYPNDIMLTVKWNITHNTLGDFTAYCVGWTDTMPSVCSDPRWWS